MKICLHAVPLQPGEITVTEIGSTSVRISWAAAGGFFHKYQIIYQAQDNGLTIPVAQVDKSVTEYIILGLEESTAYSIYVETVSGTMTSTPRTVDGIITSKCVTLSGI